MEGDELHDQEYGSIYGEEALHARQMARMDGMLRRQADCIARLDALLLEQEARRVPLPENPIVALRHRLEDLERENDELRRREIRRFWGEEEIP